MRGVPVSWRTAAIYCNWLHNGKSTDAAAFMSGAYDVSTFSASDFPTFTDQASRSPGARYWIPSWDEWLKAVHYDPLKPNLDGSLGGWWQGPLGSDALPVYGPPVGFPNGSAANQANSDWSGPNFPGRLVPLGSYPNAQTPWGLLDAAGGTGEWTESIYTVQSRMSRISEGSEWDDDASGDEIFLLGGTFRPNTSSTDIGLRIATSIPQPGILATALPCVLLTLRRSRR
jgi:formylglycine-generating enzyme required for sulfatase activity